MNNIHFEFLFSEIEYDIINQTRGLYDAGDLITLQSLLMQDYTKVTDNYYINNINLDDCIALKLAIRDIIRKISWSLYHSNYREMMWIKEFHKSYEECL